MSDLPTYDQIDELVDTDALKLRDLAWALTNEVQRLRADLAAMRKRLVAVEEFGTVMADSVKRRQAQQEAVLAATRWEDGEDREEVPTDEIRAIYAEPTPEATP